MNDWNRYRSVLEGYYRIGRELSIVDEKWPDNARNRLGKLCLRAIRGLNQRQRAEKDLCSCSWQLRKPAGDH